MVELALQFAGQSRRDQPAQILGRAQAHQPAQLAAEPIERAAGPGRDRRRGDGPERRAAGKGAADELGEVDRGDAEREKADPTRGDGEGRRKPAARGGRREHRFRFRRQRKLEPAGFLGFEDARPQPLGPQLGFAGHARKSSVGPRLPRCR